MSDIINVELYFTTLRYDTETRHDDFTSDRFPCPSNGRAGNTRHYKSWDIHHLAVVHYGRAGFSVDHRLQIGDVTYDRHLFSTFQSTAPQCLRILIRNCAYNILIPCGSSHGRTIELYCENMFVRQPLSSRCSGHAPLNHIKINQRQLSAPTHEV